MVNKYTVLCMGRDWWNLLFAKIRVDNKSHKPKISVTDLGTMTSPKEIAVFQRVTNLFRFVSNLDLLLQGEKIMARLDQLTAEVAEVQGTVASAIALIQGLAQQIKDAGTDQAALDDIVAQLNAQQEALAAAVAANSEPAIPE